MSTTFEEAKKCPKCGKPGEDRATRPSLKRGVKVHMIYCVTELCPWFDTPWLVQVNEDGTIPEEYGQVGPKQYPKVSAESETKIREALEKQVQAELRGNGEIRGF